MTLRECLRSLLPEKSVDVVSASWLKQHAQCGERSKGYDGVTLTFPIQKLRNESGGFNRYLLRRKA